MADEMKSIASFRVWIFISPSFCPLAAAASRESQKGNAQRGSFSASIPHYSTLLWIGEKTKSKERKQLLQTYPLLGMSAAGSQWWICTQILTSNPKHHFQADFPSEVPGHCRVFHTTQPHHLMLAVILMCY